MCEMCSPLPAFPQTVHPKYNKARERRSDGDAAPALLSFLIARKYLPCRARVHLVYVVSQTLET